MGRRLRTHVAPARPRTGRRGWSWRRCGRCVQRLGPHVEDVEPVVVAHGRPARPRRARRPAGRAPATGASTRSSTAARWRCAARSSTCSRRPPTRRCASTCGATRSTGSPSSPWPTSARPIDLDRGRDLPAAASCCPPTRCASGPSALDRPRALGSRAVGAAGRGPDLRRHGVVAAVAHRAASTLLLDLLAGRGPGAAGRAPPHARPGRRHPRRGGRPGRRRWPHLGRAGGDAEFPRLHLPFDRLLAHTDAPAWTVTAAPEGPDVATVVGRRLGPGRRRRRAAGARSSASCCADGYRVVVAADGAGSAAGAPPRDDGVASPSTRRRSTSPGPAAASSCSRSSAGFMLPGVKLAVLAESRRHRPAPRPPAAAPAQRTRRQGVLRRPASPATTSCTTSTASPATAAWSSGRSAASSATTCCSSTAATTSSTCRPTRSTRCATTPAASRRRCSRLGGADWQKTKARVRSAVREIAQELVVLYQTAPAHARAMPSPPTRRGSASWRRRSRTRRRPTSSRPSST